METKLDQSWDSIFKKYNIINEIEKSGKFIISANQIKEFREPRLMTKFDHLENLPSIFSKNQLSILPISRNKFLISNHEIFNKLDHLEFSLEKVEFPKYIQSIVQDEINSEAIALNCSYLTGMIQDFVEDIDIVPTVSGRMSSLSFEFEVLNLKTHNMDKIKVENSQIEIDGAYEGEKFLSLFEAKREISDTFLIRQLYYPFRLWEKRISKPVKLIYFINSNGIFSFFEYRFENPQNYNSIKLIKQKNYTLEDVDISTLEIQNILDKVEIVSEPDIPFPQANDFRKVINLCELLENSETTLDCITTEYQFDARQSSYYSNACRYLNLIEKYYDEGTAKFRLSDIGRNILSLKYIPRQLAFVKQILSHRIFNTILKITFQNGVIPPLTEIIGEMQKTKLYNIGAKDTYVRRATTIQSWINWIIALIQE